MAADPLVRLRATALALPEAHEAIAWGEPTWREVARLLDDAWRLVAPRKRLVARGATRSR